MGSGHEEQTNRMFADSVTSFLGLKVSDQRALFHQTLRAEQIQLLVRSTLILSVLNLVISTLMLGTFWIWVPKSTLFAWYGFAVLTSWGQYSVWRKCRNRPPPRKVKERTYRKSVIYSFAYGIIRGSAGVLLFVPESFAHQVFLTLMMTTMAAGAAATLAPLPAVRNVYVFAVMAPLMTTFFLQTDYEQLSMGITAIILTTANLYFARPANERFLDLILTKTELEYARSNLLDAIESSSEAFALFDAAGKPMVVNSRYRDLFGAAHGHAPVLPLEEKIHQLENGKWVKSTHRRTSTGGVVSVHADITDFKDNEKDLHQARDLAESANETKSEFLALMSHELRTPLNAIIGFSDMLKDSHAGVVLDAEKTTEYAEYIHQSGSHLLNLINDILDLSKIEAGRYQIYEEEVDLVGLAENLCGLMTPVADEGYITLVNDVDMGVPRLMVDERAVRQMLINLLSNAIKFTEPGGRVTLKTRITETEFIIAIEDTGIGIAPENLDAVLEPFRQVESHLNRKIQGTGLGIPLVCRLAKLHDGFLVLESEPAVGTVAQLHFPVERAITSLAPLVQSG